MKKLFVIFYLTVFCSFAYSQNLPTDFRLEGKNNFAKINADNPIGNTIEKIIIVQNTIWLGTSQGVSKSTDNGETWTNYEDLEEFGDESVAAIGYHNSVFWASTWHPEEDAGGSTIAVGSGLRYTTDQGENWNVIDQPVDSPDDTVEIYGINEISALPITAEEQNFIRDIDFTGNIIWIATNAGGLRKSSDMGQTWNRVVLPPDYLNEIAPDDTLSFDLSPSSGNLGYEENLNHIGFSILAANDTLYVGTAGGINKSTDGGISWVKFNAQNEEQPISGNHILAIERSDYDGSILAGTWKTYGETEFWGISRTTDGGKSWETSLEGARTLGFGFKYLYSGNNITGADLFAATQDGLYRTSNNGATWISAPDIIDSQSGIRLGTKEFSNVKAKRRNDNTTDIWVGSYNGLVRLNESDSDFWTGNWKVFVASKTIESATETYAFPNPFSPNSRSVRIKYSLNNQSDVTIRIFDFGMNLVRTLIQNAPRNAGNSIIEEWNGRDEAGNVVPNGVYFYRIDINSNDRVYGKIMVLK